MDHCLPNYEILVGYNLKVVSDQKHLDRCAVGDNYLESDLPYKYFTLFSASVEPVASSDLVVVDSFALVVARPACLGCHEDRPYRHW
jgi:hypothetical protein